MQAAVILKGTLHGSRDPTAVLVSRMNSVLKEAQAQGWIPQGQLHATPGGTREGDWYCNRCNDLQFAKNNTCRCCGSSRAEVEAEGGPQLPDPQTFLAAFAIEEDKKMQFFALPPEMQMAIVAKGTLA